MTRSVVTAPTERVVSNAQARVTLPRYLLALAVGAPAVLLGVLGWSHRWTGDDGFIFFRVVDQVLDGNGPVFNAGERVEIATSPLWLAFLVVARAVVPSGVALGHIAMWLALGLTVLGLTAAGLGAARLARVTSVGTTRWLVPFGSVAVVAIAAFWDYATSGLEVGLSLAWLGGCFWALVSYALAEPTTQRRWRWALAVLVGLGPLVRPDLAIFTVCFLGAQLALGVEARWRARLGVVAAAVALPVLVQVLRMGYYASLVPNTAIAKNAGDADWAQGFDYLRNLIASYRLAVLLPFAAIALALLFRSLVGTHRRTAMIAAAPLVGAALHTLYIVRIGGDFIHARLLLPSLFAALCPIMVIEVRRFGWLLVGGVGIWAVVALSWWRPLNAADISDQREFSIEMTDNAHPVTLADYRDFSWLSYSRTARVLAAGDQRILYLPAVGSFLRQRQQGNFGEPERRLPLAGWVEARAAVAFNAIGAVSYAAGTDVFVIDRLGLGDPVGSRLTNAQNGLQPGHEKFTTLQWIEARYAAPRAQDPDPLRQLATGQARQALSCGDLARLLRDIEAPLTPGRFLGNLVDATANTTLSIPRDAAEAARTFCGP